MTSHGDEVSTVSSRVVVAYPDVYSSREARTIGRLKLALVVVSLGLLVVTVLFVWQITKKNNASNQVSYKGPVVFFKSISSRNCTLEKQIAFFVTKYR